MRVRKAVKLIAILLVLAVAAAGIVLITGRHARRSAPSDAPSSGSGQDEMREFALTIAGYFKDRDYGSIAALVHPVYGVVFSPYATVNLSTAKCFTPAQVEKFASDGAKYIWGVYSGDGNPIEMTPEEYVSEFVCGVDYTQSEETAVDEILHSGNALENVTEAFPDAHFVDLYMPGTDAIGQNWNILRIVFEEYEGHMAVTAVIHSGYTI